MRKILVVVMAVAVSATFALAAMAGEMKETTKTTEKGVGTEKTTVTATTSGNVQIHDVTKFKHGDLWKDDVTFDKWDENGDYMYVINDNKTYRVKMKDSAKTPGLTLKKGQPISITSTYPLAGTELQNYIVISKIEQLAK